MSRCISLLVARNGPVAPGLAMSVNASRPQSPTHGQTDAIDSKADMSCGRLDRLTQINATSFLACELTVRVDDRRWRKDVPPMTTMTITPATIHVVDDDPSFRVAIARLLRAAGYQVVVYESGEQLLANPPGPVAGCILLDMRMPELDGLDVQERLNEIGSSLPIVFLTGHGSVETSVQAIEAGAEDVLTKPVSKSTLLEAVEQALVRHRERIDQHSKSAILRSASLKGSSKNSAPS
jgi:FixJ family two-component response regulator